MPRPGAMRPRMRAPRPRGGGGGGANAVKQDAIGRSLGKLYRGHRSDFMDNANAIGAPEAATQQMVGDLDLQRTRGRKMVRRPEGPVPGGGPFGQGLFSGLGGMFGGGEGGGMDFLGFMLLQQLLGGGEGGGDIDIEAPDYSPPSGAAPSRRVGAADTTGVEGLTPYQQLQAQQHAEEQAQQEAWRAEDKATRAEAAAAKDKKATEKEVVAKRKAAWDLFQGAAEVGEEEQALAAIAKDPELGEDIAAWVRENAGMEQETGPVGPMGPVGPSGEEAPPPKKKSKKDEEEDEDAIDRRLFAPGSSGIAS